MKKWMKLLLLVLLLGFGYRVHATDYPVATLIPLQDSATVDTDLFTYTGIHYIPVVEGKDYGRFVFDSILNKADKSTPVSINILLFDANEKNIGYVAYCTTEDVESDYAHMKLAAGTTTAFHINVSKRYLMDEKASSDVVYYSVLDDNPYCHVGGRDKYQGLTLTEIISGKVVTDEGKKETVHYEDFVNMSSLFLILSIAAGVLIGLIIQGLILNALYKRMFATTTALSYLPIASNYVAVKLAFGGKIAMIYIIAFLVSVVLSVVGIGVIIIFFLGMVSGFAFLIVIIKLITKKYDLLYLEPFENNMNVAIGGGFSLRPDEDNQQEVYVTKDEKELDEPVNVSSNGEEVLDLNFGEPSSDNGFAPLEPVSNLGDDPLKPVSNLGDDPEEPKKSNEPEGNSDLMNLFK